MTSPDVPHLSNKNAITVEVLLTLGQTPAEVAQRLEQELAQLNTVLAAVQPYWQNLIPGRSWTAGQECEHILLVSEAGARVAALLLSERPLPAVPHTPITLTADGKRQAPSATQPSTHPGPLSDYQERLDIISHKLPQLARRAPTHSERVFFHPTFGEIDALNWLRVTAAHLRGHRLELEKLLPEAQA